MTRIGASSTSPANSAAACQNTSDALRRRALAGTVPPLENALQPLNVDAPRPRLDVSGLAKSVPGGRLLFAGLDLSVGAGEIVAIVGESGVGKSTLLNILAGLDDSDAGTVRIEGTVLGDLGEADRTRLRRERIGFVFQAFHVLPYLTLRQNVALPLALVSADSATIDARAEAMLEAVGLGSRGSGYARDLSGGELQRVAIARALVHRPALILADEPTGNLDTDTAATVLDLFADAVRKGNAAAVIVTHSQRAATIADHVLTLTADGLKSLTHDG